MIRHRRSQVSGVRYYVGAESECYAEIEFRLASSIAAESRIATDVKLSVA